MSTPAPDWILHSGVVHTVDDRFSTADAIAIGGSRIIFVGSSAEALELAGDATRSVDLAGRTVTPGFTDCHLHPLYAAGNLDQLQLGACRSIDEILACVKERAEELPAGEWFRGSNHWSLD